MIPVPRSSVPKRQRHGARGRGRRQRSVASASPCSPRARGYRVLEAAGSREPRCGWRERNGRPVDLAGDRRRDAGHEWPRARRAAARGVRPTCKVLYITGYAEEAIRAPGHAAGGRRAPGEAVHRRRSSPTACARRPGRRGDLMLNLPAATPPGALDLTGDAARRRRDAAARRRSRCSSAPATRSCCRPPSSTKTSSSGPAAPAWRSGCSAFPTATGASWRCATTLPPASRASRRPPSRAPALPLRLSYSGKVYRQEPERGGRPARDAPGRRRAAGRRRRSPPTWRSCGSPSTLIRSAGLEDFQVNLGHVGVLAPGLAALEEPLRSAGAPVDRPQGPRRALPRARRPRGRRRARWRACRS